MLFSDFLELNKINAQLLKSKEQHLSFEKLVLSFDFPFQNVAKTFLFLSTEDILPVMAVIELNSMPSIEKLEKASISNGLKLATFNESINITGYEPEWLPPISIYGVKIFLSKNLLEKKEIIVSTGDNFHLLKISPQQLIEHGFEVTVADISV